MKASRVPSGDHFGAKTLGQCRRSFRAGLYDAEGDPSAERMSISPARHANASQVDVTVDASSDGMLTVQVTDNGTGIPAGGRRSGLRNLASRAEKLGGKLSLEPANPGASAPGTRLEWRVPR